jgi:hypothetical protein
MYVHGLCVCAVEDGWGQIWVGEEREKGLPCRRGRSHSHLSQHSRMSYACEQREKVRNKADAEEDGAQFETTEIQIFDPKYPDLGKRQFLWCPASPCYVFE